jgi:molybdate transport system substrate-binding protein
VYRRSFLILAGGAAGCGRRPDTQAINAAAAANLTGVFDEIGRAFTRETGVAVTFSYGATALLAHQIANGAPFDVFAAADTQHPAQLLRSGLVEKPAVYARGRLALWAPRHAAVKSLADLTRSEIRFIAIARPAAAPYGAAAVEALRRTSIWDRVEPKVVYVANVNAVREYANSGSADAALTAWPLVRRDNGALQIDAALHPPLEQAVAVVSGSPRLTQARQFAAFLLGAAGRQILINAGYESP